jgi:hypothetical protein
MVLALAVTACHSAEVRTAAAPKLAAEPAPAQAQAPRVDLERFRPDVDRLLAEALARGQSWQLLSGLCTTAPTRLSGSVGAEKAVQWAAQAMRDAGLAVRLEPVMVPRWERGELESLLELDAAGAPRGSFPILALGGSVATAPGGVSAEVISVTSFDELRARAGEARGKIVLLNRPMDPGQHDCFAAYGGAVDQRGRGASEAAKAGARAVLVRSMTMALDDHPRRHEPGRDHRRRWPSRRLGRRSGRARRRRGLCARARGGAPDPRARSPPRAHAAGRVLHERGERRARRGRVLQGARG